LCSFGEVEASFAMLPLLYSNDMIVLKARFLDEGNDNLHDLWAEPGGGEVQSNVKVLLQDLLFSLRDVTSGFGFPGLNGRFGLLRLAL
jgi:hypothetical protein